ncbi:hypothetical protein, partial [Rhodoplanes elegans]
MTRDIPTTAMRPDLLEKEPDDDDNDATGMVTTMRQFRRREEVSCPCADQQKHAAPHGPTGTAPARSLEATKPAETRARPNDRRPVEESTNRLEALEPEK